MRKVQKERLERAGWRFGSASELLGLTEAEDAIVEAKLRLADVVRQMRQEKHLSQAALAKLIGSSQSRVARIENRDREVSLELQMKAVFAANPGALRDFEGLIRKWSTRRPAASRRAVRHAPERSARAAAVRSRRGAR